MNPLFAELGVPAELQAFFQLQEPVFSYEQDYEYFGRNMHFVPTTQGMWMAGNYTASELVITTCAMEAIAYLTLNLHRYPVISAVSLMALGCLPCKPQLEWITSCCQKRKITLVHSKDLTGRLADIRVAAGIRNREIRLDWNGNAVICRANGRSFSVNPESLTLNSFEKAAGLRSGIRTRKPNLHNTYLEQLRYEQQQ